MFQQIMVIFRSMIILTSMYAQVDASTSDCSVTATSPCCSLNQISSFSIVTYVSSNYFSRTATCRLFPTTRLPLCGESNIQNTVTAANNQYVISEAVSLFNKYDCWGGKIALQPGESVQDLPSYISESQLNQICNNCTLVPLPTSTPTPTISTSTTQKATTMSPSTSTPSMSSSLPRSATIVISMPGSYYLDDSKALFVKVVTSLVPTVLAKDVTISTSIESGTFISFMRVTFSDSFLS